MTVVIFSPIKGIYDFPGGKSIVGEDLPNTALREFREETNASLDTGTMKEVAVKPRGKDWYGIYVFVTDSIGQINSGPEGIVSKIPLQSLINGMLPLSWDSQTALKIFLREFGWNQGSDTSTMPDPIAAGAALAA